MGSCRSAGGASRVDGEGGLSGLTSGGVSDMANSFDQFILPKRRRNKIVTFFGNAGPRFGGKNAAQGTRRRVVVSRASPRGWAAGRFESQGRTAQPPAARRYSLLQLPVI